MNRSIALLTPRQCLGRKHHSELTLKVEQKASLRDIFVKCTKKDCSLNHVMSRARPGPMISHGRSLAQDVEASSEAEGEGQSKGGARATGRGS